MCGQRLLGTWNLGSWENKTINKGVNVCVRGRYMCVYSI